jgi:hypothetical protein
VAALVIALLGLAARGDADSDDRPGPLSALLSPTPSHTPGPASSVSTPTQSTSPSRSPAHAPARPRSASPPFPGYLLIADRGNDRMLLVNGRKRILWAYPKPGTRPSMPFNFDDDAFFGPRFDRIVSNQEAQQTIEIISFPGRKVLWRYGHVNVAGSHRGFLHTPDDAYLLANGVVVVADVGNCRVLFISRTHQPLRQIGTTGACGHHPPKLVGAPNGDTPGPGGRVLVTEITGSWIDAVGPGKKLLWSVRAPVRYPSDAQWLGHGRILLADYSSPGHVLIMSRRGRVLWKYGPPSGPAALNHPSLALMLPNGLIAVNDDYRHRVVLIDRKRHRIVWQYGHTDHPGRAHGYLDTPDGMDFLPFAVAIHDPKIRNVVLPGKR